MRVNARSYDASGRIVRARHMQIERLEDVLERVEFEKIAADALQCARVVIEIVADVDLSIELKSHSENEKFVPQSA
jgi:hypothetical protein